MIKDWTNPGYCINAYNIDLYRIRDIDFGDPPCAKCYWCPGFELECPNYFEKGRVNRRRSDEDFNEPY